MQHAAMPPRRASGAAMADPPGIGLRPLLCQSVLQRALINQADALLAGQAINGFKVRLTYCVPFLVTTYGAHCAMWMVPRPAPVGRGADRSS